MIKIGLFSLKDGVGCTAMTIHIANYLAGIEGKTVAVVEPKKKGILLNTYEESIYASVDADYEDDGTFVLNNVRYYPSKRRGPWIYDSYELVSEERVPTEDIVIYDFGHVGFLHEFDESFDKLFLCTDGKSLADEVSFVKDTKCNPEVLLFGASKEVLNQYQDFSFKCILVGNKKEERIPRNFASSLEIFLRLNRITPPEYHKDWTYAPVIFDYKGTPKPEEKQSLFDKMFGRKKKTEAKPVVKKESKEEIKPQEASGVTVAENIDAKDANIYEDYSFVSVPDPEDFEDEEFKEVEETITEPAVEEPAIEEIAEEVPEEVVPVEVVDEKQKELDEQIAANEALDKKLSDQKAKTEQLIEANKKALEEKDSVLKAKEAEVKAIKDQFSKEKEAKEAELSKKEDEISSIKAAAKKNTDDLKGKLSEKEDELSAIKQKALNDSKEKDAILSAKQKEIDDLKALVDNNAASVDKLKEKQNEFNELKTRLENESALKDKALSDKEAEINSIKEELSSTIAEKDVALKEKESELDNIKAQITKKKEEADAALAAKEAEVSSIKEENEKLKNEADTLREENERAEAEILEKDAENKRLLEQARLEKERADKLLYEANHDEMTGLLNKRAFNTAIAEFETSKGALIFVDVNDLKKTNDTISHEAGDKLLTAVSEQLTRHFKDETYRIGGDEFIILTPNDKDVEKKINSILKALATLTKRDGKITYSISYGISYCDGVKDIFALKSEADAKMYEFKKQFKIENASEEEPAVVTRERDRRRQMAGSQVKGLLGKVITYILKDEANVCNMYIVTKDERLIIFDDPNSFFNKLELLKREIRDMDRIHYIIVSHMDESEPKIITDDYTLDDPFVLLEALDADLRRYRLNDDDIRRHKELILFEEIILA